MRMTVKEFASYYHIHISGVYYKIKKREKELSGHIWKKGQFTYLDEVAQELLKPRFERGLSDRIKELENENNDLKDQNADIVLENKKVGEYIEKLEGIIEKLKSENAALKNEKEEWKNRFEVLEKEVNMISSHMTGEELKNVVE